MTLWIVIPFFCFDLILETFEDVNILLRFLNHFHPLPPHLWNSVKHIQWIYAEKTDFRYKSKKYCVLGGFDNSSFNSLCLAVLSNKYICIFKLFLKLCKTLLNLFNLVFIYLWIEVWFLAMNSPKMSEKCQNWPWEHVLF